MLDTNHILFASLLASGPCALIFNRHRQVIVTMGVLLVSVLIVRLFFWEPFRVSGSSMSPTLPPGSALVVNKAAYRPIGLAIASSSPARGDIVAIKMNDEVWFKRVAAGPGQLLFIQNQTIKTPANTVYVLGDNPSTSLDSRQLGPIPLSRVIGRVDWSSAR